jgi:hypothetical protein
MDWLLFQVVVGGAALIGVVLGYLAWLFRG